MTTLSYDNNNFPAGITTSRAGTTFQQLGMVFNPNTGNLSSRSDLRRGLSESFTYDNLDRLEQSQVAGLTALEMEYEDNGNISYKSDAGEYDYDPLRSHAVTSVSSSQGPTPFPLEQQDITYTLFHSVKTITEGSNSLSIQYGPDRQRRRMVLDRDGLTTTTLYGRNYERVTSGSEVKHYHYIGSPTGLAAILINGQVYFPLSDHLGSITGLVSSTTYTLVEEYSYDPWGRRRNPDNWSYENVPVSVYLTRGYTGHEHLDDFGLINMNGRMYDPLLGRFLSPDNYVQMPYGTQGFNRFGYCLNNPLKYTDPSGEWVHIVIGAVVGGVINLATNWNNVDNFWEGLAVFGAGAGNGSLTAAFGPLGALGGGVLTGATNNIVAQTGNGVGLNQVNWGQVGLNAGVGGVASIAGYGAGQFASKYIGGVIVNGFNITSPVLKTTISGAIGGAAGGYVGGYTGGYLMTGDPSAAHQAGMSGLKMGAGIGAATGFAGGLKYCHDNNINPWTGVRNNSVTIGEGMYRVDPATKDLGNSNINKDWPADMDAYYDKPSRMTNPNAMEFNGQWIEIQMNNEVYIYDIGTTKGGPVTSPYYNMEVGRTMIYPNVVPVRYIHYQQTIRILIISR